MSGLACLPCRLSDVGVLPAVWQELIDSVRLARGQPGEHILELGIWVVPVHARRLDQAHNRRRPLARAQTASKQPVVAANGNRPDLVLDPVVGHGQLPVTCEPCQRLSAPRPVVERLGAC